MRLTVKRQNSPVCIASPIVAKLLAARRLIAAANQRMRLKISTTREVGECPSTSPPKKIPPPRVCPRVFLARQSPRPKRNLDRFSRIRSVFYYEKVTILNATQNSYRYLTISCIKTLTRIYFQGVFWARDSEAQRAEAGVEFLGRGRPDPSH